MAQKKTFKDNISPAMQFITPPAGENPFGGVTPNSGLGFPAVPLQPLPKDGKIPAGFKPNPLYVETKSKRLQLLIQPSLFEKIKTQAKAKGESVNEYIHSILEETTREERATNGRD